MRTISQTVEDILRRSPFLLEIMSEGLSNNAQIARRIKPDVEKRLMEEVSEAAIAMALHRMQRNLARPAFGERYLRRMSDITVRSNLVEFSFPSSVDMTAIVDAMSKSARGRTDTFINFSRGIHESLLLVDTEFEDTVTQALGGKEFHRTAGLSAITIRLPEESLAVPGLYHPILKALAMEGISFVEVMSVRTEFSIMFEDKDIDHAFSVIKRITS